jgi:hypothetical protein
MSLSKVPFHILLEILEDRIRNRLQQRVSQ